MSARPRRGADSPCGLGIVEAEVNESTFCFEGGTAGPGKLGFVSCFGNVIRLIVMLPGLWASDRECQGYRANKRCEVLVLGVFGNGFTYG